MTPILELWGFFDQKSLRQKKLKKYLDKMHIADYDI